MLATRPGVAEIKHPVDVPGWEGNLKQLAYCVENLRYDRLYLFLTHLKEALGERAFKDWSAGRQMLSLKLSMAAKDVKLVSDNIKKAWAICQKHTPDFIKNEPPA